MKLLTAPGKHGTLYRFRVHYRDKGDECCPLLTWTCWAYNYDHCYEKFWDSDDDGWRVVSVERVYQP